MSRMMHESDRGREWAWVMRTGVVCMLANVAASVSVRAMHPVAVEMAGDAWNYPDAQTVFRLCYVTVASMIMGLVLIATFRRRRAAAACVAILMIVHSAVLYGYILWHYGRPMVVLIRGLGLGLRC